MSLMARLNEPAAPVESVEALKRRFIRQNREIARANSTQSVRIRNLEAEVSRLLSENLTLREQVISQQHELESRPKMAAIDSMGLVRDQLEIKLAELNSLVFDLGKAHKSCVVDPPQIRRRSHKHSPKRSPNERIWRNALTLSECTGGQDGRLPPILEDKYFPRRTLDPQEIYGIISDGCNSADSPDIGPPPIAHFDDGDPVKNDGPQYPALDVSATDIRSELAFSNLETRKKRRESSFSREGARTSTTNPNPIPEETSIPTGGLANQPLKASAKRKLSTRESEERSDVPPLAEKDGFRFNRLVEASIQSNKDCLTTDSNTKTVSVSRRLSQDLAAARGVPRDRPREPTTSAVGSRKALGEKSVNTDPVNSPVKNSKQILLEKASDMKKDVFKKAGDRDRPRSKSATGKPIRVSQQHTEVKSENSPVEKQPELAQVVEPTLATPIHTDLNLFSPISSNPSTTGPDSRDTPPPADIYSDASSTATTAGRTARRVRGSVSYAEPNLRDKMRRPGKELVDAVGADERIVRAGSAIAESSIGDAQRSENVNGKMQSVFIKKEERNGLPRTWSTRELETERADPTSPLSAKAKLTEDLPTSIMTDRRRHTKEQGKDQDLQNSGANQNPVTGSNSTIAALVAGSQRKGSHNRDKTAGSSSTNRGHGSERSSKSHNGDVYDFHSSSDIEGKDSAVPRPSTVKRSASVSDTLQMTTGADSEPTLTTDGVAADSTVNSIAGSLRGRRRRETLANPAADGDGKDAAAGVQYRSSKLGLAVSGEEVKTVEVTRADRAVARRRSMMV